MKNLVFKLFANCIPVKGAKRCIIVDLQRRSYYFIPEGLYEILTQHQNKPVTTIKAAYDFQIDAFIDKFFNYLEEEKLGFYCDNPENFPSLSLEWDSPNPIDNAILEIESTTIDHIEQIFKQLTQLNCRFLELRIIQPITLKSLEAIIKKTENTTFRNIALHLPFIQDYTKEAIDEFLITYQRVGEMVIHSANQNDMMSKNTGVKVYFTEQDLSSNHHCGQISKNYFSTNIPIFTESQHHNTCLNRKISIDQHGNIKNCPSMTQSYGNIKDTTLQEALNHPDFKQYWNIKKDQISVCKDCEFRHICTDCRAYVENPEDIYSKPLKCGYNPYTAEWADWSTNPLKEKAKAFYGMVD